MRISDWSAYVCSSDLSAPPAHQVKNRRKPLNGQPPAVRRPASQRSPPESLADKGSHGRRSSPPAPSGHRRNGSPPHAIPHRKSDGKGKSWQVRVDLVGTRNITKHIPTQHEKTT